MLLTWKKTWGMWNSQKTLYYSDLHLYPRLQRKSVFMLQANTLYYAHQQQITINWGLHGNIVIKCYTASEKYYLLPLLLHWYYIAETIHHRKLFAKDGSILLDIRIFITNFIIAKSLPTNLWCLEQIAIFVDVFSNLCL